MKANRGFIFSIALPIIVLVLFFGLGGYYSEESKLKRAAERFEQHVLEEVNEEYLEYRIIGHYSATFNDFSLVASDSFKKSLTKEEQYEVLKQITGLINSAMKKEYEGLDKTNSLYPYGKVSLTLSSDLTDFRYYGDTMEVSGSKETIYNSNGEVITSHWQENHELYDSIARCQEGTRETSAARIWCTQAIEEKYFSNPEKQGRD